MVDNSKVGHFDLFVNRSSSCLKKTAVLRGSYVQQDSIIIIEIFSNE